MRIFVCVKHVPDTAVNIKIIDGTGYDESVKYVPNPYDEYGVEEAVTLVENAGEGEVIALCVGSKAAVNTLKSVMAMGVHKSILVTTDDLFPGSDRIAKALARVIEIHGPADLIFTGKQSVDSEGMQTPYHLGAQLGLPVVTGVVEVSLQGETAHVKREIDSGSKECLTIRTPCIIGATKGLNEPRYPKLMDILKAKKKEIKQIDLDTLGPMEGTKVHLKHLEPVRERSNARILEGSTEDKVNALVKILREQEKVI